MLPSHILALFFISRSFYFSARWANLAKLSSNRNEFTNGSIVVSCGVLWRLLGVGRRNVRAVAADGAKIGAGFQGRGVVHGAGHECQFSLSTNGCARYSLSRYLRIDRNSTCWRCGVRALCETAFCVERAGAAGVLYFCARTDVLGVRGGDG